MSKTECELLLKQMETKLDDLQVKWAKHQKDISDRMKTAVSDLTKSGTADCQDISQLATKINEIQLKVSDGSDHGSGINFRAFSDENLDPSAWWRDFESCAEFKKFSSEKQLSALKVLLKGSAGVWLDRTLTNDIPDTDSCAEKLKKIKKAFIDKFEKNNTWLDEHLIHFMSQRPHEPVQKYYSRLMTKVASILIFTTLYWDGATSSNIHGVKISVTNKIRGKPMGKSNGHPWLARYLLGIHPQRSSRP